MGNLIPVAFHGATLLAVLINGIPHVSVRSICEALGLDYEAQHARLRRHPVLSATISVTKTVAADGKSRDMLCLPLSLLNGWLFGVSAARVKPELRDKLIAYQRECFDVLAAHFGAKAAPALPAPEVVSPFKPGSRWIASYELDGSVSMHPLPWVYVCGTPDELAKAIACGGWGLRDVAVMMAACTESLLSAAKHVAAAERRIVARGAK